ncbi:MAG: Lrp/AsnC family transcriptional regulator [Nanoarchaeota archaeon]
MDIDNVDKAILNALIAHSKLSFRDIAKEVKVSVATVMHRVKALEKEGIIKKYTTVVDYEKLGYDVEVMIELEISKGKLFEVERRIATHPNVFAVYDLTGRFDAAVLARFKTRRQMDNFLKHIQTFDFIERTNTRMILNTVKEKRVSVE